MATFSQWVEGARPRTLPAALAPVAVGTGSAAGLGHWDAALALLALLVALFLQIGVNYANDYSDGIRGTDAERVGPVRLVGQRLAPPLLVKYAAFACFGLACLAGLALMGLSGVTWLLLLGAAAVLAAWFYTGGRRPYGYAGLGEVFVFVFFGLVATVCTTYTQVKTVDAGTWAGAVGIGSIITAVLVANNLRDRAGDEVAGKRTLAVRLGDRSTRWFYVALLVAVPAICTGVAAWAGHLWALLALLGLAPAIRPVRAVLTGATGKELVAVLAATGLVALTYGALLTVGLAIR
ncbi:1,4-dihydroxy-2-naphthoate polyprenyltransferase [Arsenicicoccus sp. oral taxon 190]|uniref:1,4-dihydroxy-2-naphthoate polyprenyltransferase n=1 Tax=Arsenicicoccus sp. oral taxon 190 TaxID=1658671 RepID=UPI00067A17B4|nr:1,4-dihydroxy-2-naphthoate polyprenyltransferase [Arsenicicoccus sp. oral taxon 190]AKT51203.1 1,4-dihydroxy-2-naphthoate prenyltransferase [Arsenicicoccus sp. oral taxon 190]